MKDAILERIKELAKEINTLLENREQTISRINKIDSDISAKQGAIYEFKTLLDSAEEELEKD